MNITLVDLPGAGKGTQVSGIVKKLPIPHIPTGDIFRRAIGDETDLDEEAKSYVDRGELVPSEATVGIIKERIFEDDAERGLLLDGLSKTIEQAEVSNNIMSELDRNIDIVIDIGVSEEKLVSRLTGRHICRKYGTAYHPVFNPLEVDGVCDTDGGKFYQHKDDNPETVSNRLGVNVRQSEPILGYYNEKGVLKNIDGARGIDEATKDVIDVLDQLK